ncbi:MAG: DUF2232 domain-containing protein [Erysipelotrichales bacterium]|nr:DUF2232 domain-containing protein [Erysipelotrichales bacterium]
MNSTKKLTEGAMMCALIGALLFINRQSAGMIDFALYWIIPLPIIMYTIKYGIKDASLVAVSTVLLAFIAGMPSGLYYAILAAAVGLLYGHAVRNDREHHELLLISCGISIISAFLMMFVFSALFGYNLVDDIAYLTETVREIYGSAGLVIPESFYNFIPKLLIISNIVMGLIEGLLIHLLAYIVLTRFKIKIRKIRPINTLRLSKPWGYIMGFGYVGSTYLLNTGALNINADILYCVMLVSMFVLIANGYLCAVTIMAYYKLRKFLWVLMFAIMPPFSSILVVLGFTDSISDLRDKMTYLRNS